MRIDVSRKAIAFVRSDEPVARTISSGDGVLLDLNAEGEIIAMEIHEHRASGFAELVEEHPDLVPFMDEVRDAMDEMMRDISPMRRKRNRRALEMASDFAHHVPA
jgi:uncharacterized protein YuzE